MYVYANQGTHEIWSEWSSEANTPMIEEVLVYWKSIDDDHIRYNL